ncbi:related to ribosomal protein YmL36 precursor, mitochondrial [Cephalotrichum gorgonifer]|uniref:Related to ribosomal protein YmL36, mitochondrial n=1 Tax=Cephalotrichum gorgonifer TaxID=2041049 RepID=A0AAE8MTE6_9PEZI|nr:related to ribosomal protein YmL36 precursor, mitochondrial [Cephalotrichum gorgonifer]
MRARLTGLQAPLKSSVRPTTATISQHASASATPLSRPFSSTTSLSARLIRRPRRPYTFTQMVQLSDGSTYMARTTSPQPIYKSLKDTRNHMLWQPSEKSLRNVELDEAGRLAAFRERYGRGFDLEGEGATEGDDLGDLISGYASTAEGGKGKGK